MFIDEKVIKVKAGDGGNGCASFRREKFIPKGGPNGGDGGKGGDIILVCDHNIGDLEQYHFNPNWKAGNGDKGHGSHCSGRDGESCVLRVPQGTIVYDEESGLQVAELMEDGKRVILVEGGKGGLGNMHFKSATNQAPTKFTEGVKVGEKEFRLEMKVIADIGLVGYPNAGKSTLTRTITNGKPKVAPYPFTTKIPNVGIIEYPEKYKRLILADIPGLIEGASENRGLGHKFLKHIERCRVLLILLDMSGIDQRDPLEDYKSLLKELSLYAEELLTKKRIVVGNKMDTEEGVENMKRFKKKFKDVEIMGISCYTKEGVDSLKENLLRTMYAVEE